MDIKLEDGNVKDVEVTEVTAQNYIVPENEKHLFHVKIFLTFAQSAKGQSVSALLIKIVPK